MGLRDKLEGIKKNKESERALEDQQALDRQAESEKQQQQDFLTAYASSRSIDTALNSFRSAQTSTREALHERKKEFRNIKNLIQELRDEDPSIGPISFKEAISSADEGSDEERYLHAKELAVSSISKLRENKALLKELGIDADGTSDTELANVANEVLTQKLQHVREYARQHPNSELQEVQEVREEMIAEVKEKFIAELYPRRLNMLGKALDDALVQMERKGWNRQSLEEASAGERQAAVAFLSEHVMRGVEKSEEYSEILKILSEHATENSYRYDTIDVQALQESLKAGLLNFKDEDGKVKLLNAMQFDDERIDTLAMIHGLISDESLGQYEYPPDEGSGYRNEVRPRLADLFDGPSLAEFSQRTVERATLQARLDNWDTDKARVLKELTGSENELNTLNSEIERTENAVNICKERLQNAEQERHNLAIAQQKLLLEKELVPSNEKIRFSNQYNSAQIVFESERKQLEDRMNELNARVSEAEQALESAQHELLNVPKKTFLESKVSYDSRVQQAEGRVAEAQTILTAARERGSTILNQAGVNATEKKGERIVELAALAQIKQFVGTWTEFIEQIDNGLKQQLVSISSGADQNREQIEALQVQLNYKQDLAREVGDRIASIKITANTFTDEERQRLMFSLEETKYPSQR